MEIFPEKTLFRNLGPWKILRPPNSALQVFATVCEWGKRRSWLSNELRERPCKDSRKRPWNIIT